MTEGLRNKSANNEEPTEPNGENSEMCSHD